ncbi:hypothetical protein D1BOALGB6SA_6134 [Olavius sp. associated proteobacterium Delta 1]|nr:hypothetical protein D1BOALGB6SA_6134 [Olavius sp. associated proteobacterium Delta 1]
MFLPGARTIFAWLRRGTAGKNMRFYVKCRAKPERHLARWLSENVLRF